MSVRPSRFLRDRRRSRPCYCLLLAPCCLLLAACSLLLAPCSLLLSYSVQSVNVNVSSAIEKEDRNTVTGQDGTKDRFSPLAARVVAAAVAAAARVAALATPGPCQIRFLVLLCVGVCLSALCLALPLQHQRAGRPRVKNSSPISVLLFPSGWPVFFRTRMTLGTFPAELSPILTSSLTNKNTALQNASVGEHRQQGKVFRNPRYYNPSNGSSTPKMHSGSQQHHNVGRLVGWLVGFVVVESQKSLTLTPPPLSLCLSIVLIVYCS